MSASKRPLHEAIALIGGLFICVGLLGIMFAPNLLVLWAVVIGFGIAGLPRAFLEWRRGRSQ